MSLASQFSHDLLDSRVELLLPSPCLAFQSSAPIPEAGFLRALGGEAFPDRPPRASAGGSARAPSGLQLLTAAVFATCDGEHLLGTHRVP